MPEKIPDQIQPQISLPNLIADAQQGKWSSVDRNLPLVCDNLVFVDWALENGLGDPNGDLRDLAVSILEQSEHELEPDEIGKLKNMMKTDGNPFVQFRAAFALFNHGVRPPEVIEKLHQASRDKDVGEIAKNYLKQLIEKQK